MNDLAMNIASLQSRQEKHTGFLKELPAIASAMVKTVSDDQILIETDDGQIAAAQVAFSCLVLPREEDRVLVARSGESGLFILGILAREKSKAMDMTFSSDVRLTVPNGQFDIIAQNGIRLGSPREIELIANKLGMSAAQCDMFLKQISMVSDQVFAQLDNVKLFSKNVKSVVGSAVQKFVNRYTDVEGVEQVTAGSIKQVAKTIFSTRSRFGFLRAEKNMKIDGKQIFMG